MSLAAAVPLAVGSAVVYGCSIVVQHRAAHRGSGEPDARGLLQLLRDPRWLMSMGGDFIGFLLQIGALATGPVVVVQPIVVLMLPVALVYGWLTGGPRPGPAEALGSFGVLMGLSTFLALISANHPRHRPVQLAHTYRLEVHDTCLAVVCVLVVSGVAMLAARGRGANLRAAVLGGAAGACFGALGVLVNSISHQLLHRELGQIFTHRANVAALIGVLLLGATGIALTQASFQIGALAATLPANLAFDPITAVVLGVLLLHQHVPLGVGHVFAYVLCVSVILAGTIRLAQRSAAESPQRETAASISG